LKLDSRDITGLAQVQDKPAVSKFFEHTSTSTIVFTDLKGSKNSMADANASSGAMSDASSDDVSQFLSVRVSFLQNYPRPTAARWFARIENSP
jgi:hypothetical protein